MRHWFEAICAFWEERERRAVILTSYLWNSVSQKVSNDLMLFNEEIWIVLQHYHYCPCTGQRLRWVLLHIMPNLSRHVRHQLEICLLGTANQTSYIDYRLIMIGTRAVGAPLLNIYFSYPTLWYTYLFVCVQLILPECMKLLPVYLNCMLKSDVLQPGADCLPGWPCLPETAGRHYGCGRESCVLLPSSASRWWGHKHNNISPFDFVIELWRLRYILGFSAAKGWMLRAWLCLWQWETQKRDCLGEECIF